MLILKKGYYKKNKLYLHDYHIYIIMNILKREEDQLCINSLKDSLIAEVHSSVKGEVSEFKPVANTIIFINKGTLRITFGLCKVRTIEEGEFFFHPATNKSLIESLSDYTITVLRFHINLIFCDHYPLEDLYKQAENEKMDEIHVLKSNAIVDHYLDSVKIYLNEGIFCSYFYELKQKEFLFILKSFYSKEDLVLFFLPILNNDLVFAQHIHDKLGEIRSVKELANLFNYSYSGFEKRFKKVFGMSANKWLQQERAKRIYHEINCSTKTILEIGYEFGFTSPSHFNDYCKRVFHQTPGKLRKKEVRPLV